ncbi:DUF975 family protein [Pediococcus ethanolidurans]|uniref:DUF975 family protein n=1 Tax=Pediococcus ethanolidurans TaxID=319653 RepID=UPI0021E6EC86|nr:DUF975 family protein [Pediococcus ethanolidurans]MCV3327872.1 DUF975 family protein [Pediococcus ethanolidurans]
MSKHQIRRDLKREVKQVFKGHWGQASMTAIVPIVLRAIIGFVISLAILLGLYLVIKNPHLLNHEVNTYTQQTTSNSRASNVWNFLRSAIVTFIGVGISYTFLDWLREPNREFAPIKSAFQVFTRRYFIPTLAIFVIQFIFLFLWTLLFIIPGVVKYYAYSQSYLIYKDQLAAGNGDRIEYIDCITMSRQLMDGHKLELFLLQLSLFGWYILSLCSFGIGFIWYVPYSQGVYAAFYKHLVAIQ